MNTNAEVKQIASDLAGQREQRLAKIERLKELGINPYPSKSSRNTYANDIVSNFDEMNGREVIVAGRLMSHRHHGQLQFADLQDATARIQLYLRQDTLGSHQAELNNLGWEQLDLLDIGDFVEATGQVVKTETGQISVQVETLRLLSKSIRPLPNKWGGIEDKETRLRRRYLDMTMNPPVRERFERRAFFWDSVREFMNENGFYEVNIPVLEHTTGGADAKPFETFFDELKETLYLRISHELPLKRLLGGGFEKVYDIGPRFRNEGVSDEHLPEHIAMEWYWAYADYKEGMKLTQEMFRYVIQRTYGKLQFNIKGHEVDLAADWEVLDFTTIIKERFGVDVINDSLEKLKEVFVSNGGELNGADNRSRVADGLWKLIRKTIAGPAFLVGVPKFLSPLAKVDPTNPELTERFHPIIAGSEAANAFSELNDPVDQLNRFVEQQQLREEGDDEAHMLDIDYVEMLEYGMPPAVGFGMSERVFWMFENVTAKEGVPFPHMRFELENSTRKIYGEEVIKYAESNQKSSVKSSDKSSSTKSYSKDFKQDKDHRIILVLNKELQGWQLTNTVAHLSAYIGNKVANNIEARPTFEVGSGDDAPTINTNAQYPIISMGANPGQMYNLLQKVEEEGLIHLAYIQEMIDFNDDEKIQEVLRTQSKDTLNYVGIGFFADNETAKRLTNKFSLWK